MRGLFGLLILLGACGALSVADDSADVVAVDVVHVVAHPEAVAVVGGEGAP